MSVEEMVAAEQADQLAPVSFQMGIVEGIRDVAHVDVMLGQTAYPVTVPSSLMGACMIGSEVRVQVQGNSRVLDSVRTGAWIGELKMWRSSAIPVGWLVCDGSTYNTTTYPFLYAHLGVNFLPNLEDRVPVGASATKAIRTAGGSEYITAANMPTHDHSTLQRTTAVFDATAGTTFHGVTEGSDYTGDAGSGTAYWQPWYALHYIVKAA